MALAHWSPNLTVGIDFIDADHKQLIQLINELDDALRVGGNKTGATQKLDELIDATRQHFDREEQAMKDNNYGGFEQHQRLHEALLQEIIELREQFISGEMNIGPETTTFLKDWLISHILESDKHLGGFLEGRSSR